MAERVFGNYPNLHYDLDRCKNALPDNINVIEFYLAPGKFLFNTQVQRNYLSTNYTHAVRDVLNKDVNVICQIACEGDVQDESVFSLSCNPDITVDIAEKMRDSGRPVAVVGEVNPDLPFMYGESIVKQAFFDFVLKQPETDYPVFGPPKMSVTDADYMIGIHASTLVKDDGELQIGIGSLGDALVYSLCMRHGDNATYKDLLKKLDISTEVFPVIEKDGSLEPFETGLFAATEMFVDSFAHLVRFGILKKKVFDSVLLQRLINKGLIQEHFDATILRTLLDNKAIHANLSETDFHFLQDFGIFTPDVSWNDGKLVLPDGEAFAVNLLDEACYDKVVQNALGSSLRNGAIAHAGFFLGPRDFYQFLKDLPVEERKLIRMKRISQINQLYGHEEIDRLQRKNGRFINTCMKVSLNGAASSDALANGQQVSGVGGQFNFVTMAHELPDARSILQLRSARPGKDGGVESNIVFRYGECTVPRHMRDIVITEYGIADIRGRTDEEVALALIHISDSRVQESLLQQSIAAGKVRADYQIPERFRHNLPERYQTVLKAFKSRKFFQPFPFGTDLTQEEQRIGKVLKHLKALKKSRSKLIGFILGSLFTGKCPDKFLPLLDRMDLRSPANMKERLFQKMLTHGFKQLLR
jgi:acyl-CoA hydrolase